MIAEGLKKRYEYNFKPNFNKRNYEMALKVYKDFPEIKSLLSPEEQGRMIYMTEFKNAYKNNNWAEANSLACNKNVKKCLEPYESNKLNKYSLEDSFPDWLL